MGQILAEAAAQGITSDSSTLRPIDRREERRRKRDDERAARVSRQQRPVHDATGAVINYGDHAVVPAIVVSTQTTKFGQFAELDLPGGRRVTVPANLIQVLGQQPVEMPHQEDDLADAGESFPVYSSAEGDGSGEALPPVKENEGEQISNADADQVCGPLQPGLVGEGDE